MHFLRNGNTTTQTRGFNDHTESDSHGYHKNSSSRSKEEVKFVFGGAWFDFGFKFLCTPVV